MPMLGDAVAGVFAPLKLRQTFVNKRRAAGHWDFGRTRIEHDTGHLNLLAVIGDRGETDRLV